MIKFQGTQWNLRFVKLATSTPVYRKGEHSSQSGTTSLKLLEEMACGTARSDRRPRLTERYNNSYTVVLRLTAGQQSPASNSTTVQRRCRTDLCSMPSRLQSQSFYGLWTASTHSWRITNTFQLKLSIAAGQGATGDIHSNKPLSHFPMLQDGRRGRCHVCKTKGIRKGFCQEWFGKEAELLVLYCFKGRNPHTHAICMYRYPHELNARLTSNT